MGADQHDLIGGCSAGGDADAGPLAAALLLVLLGIALSRRRLRLRRPLLIDRD
jgi:uncharacterized protein (TIGR03382 family)